MNETIQKIIKIPIYHGEIKIIKTDDFVSMEKRFDFPEYSMDGFGAVTFTDHKDGYTRYVMIFTNNYSVTDIAHECMHCLRYMYVDRGIEFVTNDNDEHQAYLMGWLVGETYKFLSNSKK